MITPGDLPVVLGGGGVGHIWIGASFQTDPTDFQLRRVGRKKSLKVMGQRCDGGSEVFRRNKEVELVGFTLNPLRDSPSFPTLNLCKHLDLGIFCEIIAAPPPAAVSTSCALFAVGSG